MHHRAAKHLRKPPPTILITDNRYPITKVNLLFEIKIKRAILRAGRPFSHGTFRCVVTALLAGRLATDNVACEQDFRFPVFGSRNIFYDDAPAAGAVYAHNAFGSFFHYHSHVLDVAPASEENQVARQHFVEGNAVALAGLSSGAGGNFQVEFTQDVTGESGAVETGFGRNTRVSVAKSQEILGISGNVAAHLHGLYVFGAVGWSAADALKRRAGDNNEQENG